jgi:DUF971 family protein
MAGLEKNTPIPTRIVAHQQSRRLELEFPSGEVFYLPYEFLRVHSPSAEVRGHGPGQEVLQVGKALVNLKGLEPVGHYAIQPTFDDGHSTGIYSWDYLYELGKDQEKLWSQYLAKIASAGASRGESPEPSIDLKTTELQATELKRQP